MAASRTDQFPDESSYDERQIEMPIKGLARAKARQMQTTSVSLKSDIAKFINLLEAATQNEQPITISMPLEVFKSALDFAVERRVEAYKAEEDARRQEESQCDLIRPKEVKAMMNISDATLWRYWKNGLLQKYCVGGRILYSRDEVKKLMKG